MKETHITLVGAQALPVYNGIMYSKPHSVFLLHTPDTLEIAKNIQSAFSKNCHLLNIEYPFDYFYCKQIFDDLFAEIKGNKISVNIAGGTKIMSLAAADFARENKLSMFYISQNNIVTDFTDNKKYLFDDAISLQSYFKIFGQSAKSTVLFESIDKGLFDLKDTIIKNLNGLNPLFKQVRNKKHTEGQSFLVKNEKFELAWKHKEQMAIFYSEKTRVELQLQGLQVFNVLFNTGWFELEVLEMLSKWNRLKKMYWSTIIPRKNNNTIKNEIDIIVDTGIKMFFFECKTGVSDIKDIDKFRNVVKNFGGLGAKPILITMHKPNNNIIEKCKDNKISTFWFQDAKTKNSSLQLLQFLEKEFQIINPV